MANKGKEPGEPESAAPLESRRAPAAADVGTLATGETLTEAGEAAAIDMPAMGSLAGESARPTPLDEIARAERSRLPAD